jgi:hypothetical protein
MVMATVTAATLGELPLRLWEIFYFIVLPVLLLAGVGFLLQRRLGLDMPTLTRLNFHFIVPGLIYFVIVTASVTLREAGTAVAFALAMLTGMSLIALFAARLRRLPAGQGRTLVMTTTFNNSGNYGLPLQELAFSASGLGAAAATLQSFFMLTQNFAGFTYGVLLVSGGRGPWRRNLLHVAKFPPLYALAAGLITVQLRNLLGDRADRLAAALEPFWQVVVRTKGAFVGLALLTLGAQLATVGRAGRHYPVRLSVCLRLLVGPALGLAMIYAFGLRGFCAQVLLIATTTPTAVNTMLLCLQFDNHPQFAARAVFYSTLLSPLTVTLTIFLARSGLLPGFGM